MTRFKFWLLLILVTLVALPALSWDGVESVEASGYLTRWFAIFSSPTPRYCDWRTAEPAGGFFNATNDDGTGNNGCLDPWMVHCDGDSLVYRGEWPSNDAGLIKGSNYEAVYYCSFNIIARTYLSASRSVVGNLTVDIHSAAVEFPGGAIEPILSAGSGPDQAGLFLDPGSYRVSLVVDVYQASQPGGTIDPYAGHILLKWEDPANVAVENLSWGSVKAIFR